MGRSDVSAKRQTRGVVARDRPVRQFVSERLRGNVLDAPRRERREQPESRDVLLVLETPIGDHEQLGSVGRRASRERAVPRAGP